MLLVHLLSIQTLSCQQHFLNFLPRGLISQGQLKLSWCCLQEALLDLLPSRQWSGHFPPTPSQVRIPQVLCPQQAGCPMKCPQRGTWNVAGTQYVVFGERLFTRENQACRVLGAGAASIHLLRTLRGWWGGVHYNVEEKVIFLDLLIFQITFCSFSSEKQQKLTFS